jgi:L-fuconolactonase
MRFAALLIRGPGERDTTGRFLRAPTRYSGQNERPDVWADLPKLLALAQYDNVRVKISGACTMSHQPFPYDDIWDPVLRIIDAFGLDRCMWGTEWTRTIGMLTYEQGVAPFRDTKRLSESDKVRLMGGTLSRVYNWSPSKT